MSSFLPIATYSTYGNKFNGSNGSSPNNPFLDAPTGLKYLRLRNLPPLFAYDLIKYSTQTLVSPYGSDGSKGYNSSTECPDA